MGITAGVGGLADLLAAGATDAAVDTGAALATDAAVSAPLDLLAGGAAAGTAIPGAIGAIAPASGALASGLALEPEFASSAVGAFAPGLDTSAAALGGLGATGGVPLAGLAPPGSDALPATASPTSLSPTATPWSQGGLGPAGRPPAASGVAPAGAGVAGAAPAGAGPIDLSSGSLDSLTTGAGTPNAAGTAATAAPASSNPLGALGNFLGSPTGKGLSAALSAGGIGYSLYNQEQTQKADAASIQNLQTQAANQSAAANAAAAPTLQQGQLLTSYLSSGTLPAPIQAQLDQATAAAKAQIIANAGQRGVSTDPTQNSALAQDLAAADQQALSTKGGLESQLQQAGTAMIQQANSLIATGLNATQMSSQLQEYLLSLDNQLSQQTGAAISNFAAALGGGQNKVTLNLGGNTAQAA